MDKRMQIIKAGVIVECDDKKIRQILLDRNMKDVLLTFIASISENGELTLIDKEIDTIKIASSIVNNF